jgi:cytochrome c-type biogenesis protein CcmH
VSSDTVSWRRLAGWGVAIAALIVIVVGLLPEPAVADPAQRVRQLSARIACPWCDGQSLAESGSGVATDLLVILREKVDAGWSDAEIYDFFTARYGDQILLDPPISGWGIALWMMPVVALGVGGWVVVRRLRVQS